MRNLNPDNVRCARCGQVAKGYAFVGTERYCHEGAEPTCYMLALWDGTPVSKV